MKQSLGRLVLVYFRFFAQLRLRIVHPLVIGITGSAGKTSALQAVSAVLGTSTRVKVSEKANSESGIPLNILGIKPNGYSVGDWLRMMLSAPFMALFSNELFDIYVVEMGIDSPKRPKNMEYLLTILRPHIGIFLNALPVHAAAFDPGVGVLNPSDHKQAIIEAIAREKAKMIQALPADGIGIINGDDEAVMKYSKDASAPLLTFGKKESSAVLIRSIERTIDCTIFTFIHQDETATVKFPYALTDHFGYTFAAALGVLVYRNESIIEGCNRLQLSFQLPPGRMSILKGINDSTIIDSTYNASAEPTVDALRMLVELPAKRHLALIGDMRELGAETKSEHERVLETAFQTTDQVYIVGPLMQQYGLPYAEKSGKSIRWFATSRDAGTYLSNEIRQGDVILVKGSQNTILLEIAVEMLLNDPNDAHLLCRRGRYWDKQRKKII